MSRSTVNFGETLGRLIGSKSAKDFDPNLKPYIPQPKNRSWYTPLIFIYFILVAGANTVYTMIAKVYGLIPICLDILIIAHLIYLTCTLQDMNICMGIIAYIMKTLQIIACVFALVEENKTFKNSMPIIALCLYILSALLLAYYIKKEKVIYLSKKQLEMIDNANEEDEEVREILNKAKSY